MSDSFADLWSSSAPLPPKPKPQTLSSASRPNLNQSTSSSKPDVFALLSSSGTSTPAPRYGNGASGTAQSSTSTLNVARSTSRLSNPPSRTMTPSTSSQNPQVPSTSSTMGSDAFSDLFASSSTSNTSNMTLAARLAMEAEQHRLRGSPGAQKTPNVSTPQGSHDAWAGLDSLGGSMSTMQASKPTGSSGLSGVIDDEDDWGLGDFGKAQPPSKVDATPAPAPPPRHQTPRTQTTVQSTAQAAERKKGVSLWDMEEFSGDTPSVASTSIPRHPEPRPSSSFQNKSGAHNLYDEEHVDSPDVDFDFGSREDRTDSRQSNKAGRRGLLDFEDDEERDRGYVHGNDKKYGMHRGLLDDGEDEGHGYQDTSGGIEGNRHDEDDILGMLGKPVEAARKRVEPEATNTQRTRSNQNGSSQPTRTSSPPPHILGQIVEMGFSVSEAKKALAATKDGQDVQAALERLLGASSNVSEPPPPTHPDRPFSSSQSPNAPPPPARARGAPKGQKERERERLERQRQQQQVGEGSGIPSSVAEMQDHADRLLSQASEIGSSMFSKASAFWKEGKEKVAKVYEERTGDKSGPPVPGRGATNGGGSGGGGRPRWMQEVVRASDEEDAYERETSAFKDDHPPTQRHSSQEPPPRKIEKSRAPPPEVNLFASLDEPQQRRGPSPQPRPQPIRQASSSSSIRSSTAKSQPRTMPAAPAIPIPARSLVTASPSVLSLAQKHKTAGTEQFKLGQHGTAAESYSSAISALPADHLLLVPLLTNRALTRLKTGEYAGAIGDCEKALEVILGRKIFGDNVEGTNSASAFGIEDPLAHHSKSTGSSVPPPMLQPSAIPANLITAGRSRANGGGWTHPQGVGVDLLDAYVKSLRRAAEAFEGREKWVEACAWWGVLSQAGEGDGAGWVDEKARKEAVVGSVRCRKMIDGGGLGSRDGNHINGTNATATRASQPAAPSSKQKSKPKARPPVSKSTEPSKALQALQTSNAQAEADDNAKYALKDSVDARLSAWKGGKETNIRALLASLETVLWEGASGVQGLKMGMADLVSAGQVKKGYMKAIARVHPDKLNAGNSTLEQRMLANGVFAGLNEAWISFQATQK